MKTKIKIAVRFNYGRWAGRDYPFKTFNEAFAFAALWKGEIVITIEEVETQKVAA